MIKKIKTENLEIGEIIANDVIYGERSNPLVVKNSMVTPYIKDRLKELNITTVEIYGKSKDKKDLEKIEQIKKKKTFKKQYNQNIDNVKDVFNDIVKGEKVNLNKVDKLSQKLMENADDMFTTVESIDEIREMDESTYSHSINVSLYAMMLAQWLELGENEVKEVIKVGVLHDIGKSRLDQDVLNKPGKLTQEEFEHIQQHTVLGYDICKPIIFLSEQIKNGVLMHHEKTDGSGYPLGLVGDQIPFYARIIAVCDIYDALNSKRVYKEKQTPFDSFNQMKLLGENQLDKKILAVFLKNIVSLYIGSKVKMNNGEIGKITEVPDTNISNPIVKVGEIYYDMSKTDDIKIEEML